MLLSFYGVKMMFLVRFGESMWKRGGIEAAGTFTMVFVGCGSVALERSSLEIAIAFGAIVALVIIGIGRWSGAHINPPFQSPFGTEVIFRRMTRSHMFSVNWSVRCLLLYF